MELKLYPQLDESCILCLKILKYCVLPFLKFNDLLHRTFSETPGTFDNNFNKSWNELLKQVTCYQHPTHSASTRDQRYHYTLLEQMFTILNNPVYQVYRSTFFLKLNNVIKNRTLIARFCETSFTLKPCLSF